MTDDQGTSVSRRRWMGVASIPMVAGALGSALIGQSAVGAEIERGAGTPAGPHSAGARIYNVRDFGAAGDGKTLDSAAIQAAVEACNGDHGGTVLVPAGTFLIGPIE